MSTTLKKFEIVYRDEFITTVYASDEYYAIKKAETAKNWEVFTGLHPDFVKIHNAEKDEKILDAIKENEIDQLSYARNVLMNNVFSKYEILYYQGKIAKKKPHGILNKIWQQAAKEVGFIEKNLGSHDEKYWMKTFKKSSKNEVDTILNEIKENDSRKPRCPHCGTELVSKMFDVDGTNLEECSVCPDCGYGSPALL